MNKNTVVKIRESHTVISQHLLDLKKEKKKEIKAQTESPNFILSASNVKDSAKSLFIVRFFRVLFSCLIFIPKKIIIFLTNSIQNISHFSFYKIKIKKSAKIKIENKEKTKISVKNFCNLYKIDPPHYWRRALVSFAVLSLIFVLPIKAFGSFEELQQQKDAILAKSFEGYNQLIKSNYLEAGISFASAKESINGLGFLLKHLLSAIPGLGEKFIAGNGLLIFGENISSAALSLETATAYFNEDISVIEKIKFLKIKAEQAIPNLVIAGAILDKLDNSFLLPFDISVFKQALLEGTKALVVFNNFSDTLTEMLGDKQFKRYLFIFQNNNELRATGGFIGSFAILDVDKGEIKQLEIPGGGSYDIQGQLKEFVISPEPFHLINSRWEFQDSNWFPDFGESAKKIMWFYEKSGGPTVDGVFAINSTLMEDLLGLIGPIEMKEYGGRTIDQNNFINETQKIVELEYDKEENKPKQFIADMAPKVIEKILNIKTDDLSKFSEIIHKAILSKDILVYSKDENAQEQIDSFGLSGSLRDINNFTDYLMLVDSNIAGQKTDGKIVKEIEHFSTIEDDGTIINTVKIRRKHNGIKGELFSGVRNVDYMRLYVPLGSELISAEGFTEPPADLFEKPAENYKPDKDLERIQGPVYVDSESGTRVNNEFGRTVFGNWIMVDPGDEVLLTLKYKLPYKINLTSDPRFLSVMEDFLGLNNDFFTYTMLVEKQAGAKNTRFKSRVSIKNIKNVARVGSDVALQNDGWQVEKELDSDMYYGVVLEK